MRSVACASLHLSHVLIDPLTGNVSFETAMSGIADRHTRGQGDDVASPSPDLFLTRLSLCLVVRAALRRIELGYVSSVPPWRFVPT